MTRAFRKTDRAALTVKVDVLGRQKRPVSASQADLNAPVEAGAASSFALGLIAQLAMLLAAGNGGATTLAVRG